jgi:predicted AAA+ superfamily ATPase
MLSRHARPHLDTLLRHFPCVVIAGARQCGKTTLLSTLPDDWLHLDMENGSDRHQLLADPDLFLRLHPNRIAIDEAQLAPALFPALRVAIDRERSRNGRFILSASSSPALIEPIYESLAGRVASLELGPLSLAEAWELSPSPLYGLVASGTTPGEVQEAAMPRLDIGQVWRYWLAGGYPEPWLNRDLLFGRLWQRNYIDAYLLRDVGSLFPDVNRDRYRRFILALARSSGAILNKSETARHLGVSDHTVRDWLQIAHGTYLWRRIPAWDRSPQKPLVKHPKGFLRDSGLLHRLLQIEDGERLATHPMAGRSWEGMIVETLLRGFADRGEAVQPFHYRTHDGAEIDLILEGRFGLLPVMIRLISARDRRRLRALNELIARHGCPLGLVITDDEQPRRLTEQVVAVPAAAL